jgi:hypothetical protein
MSSGWGVGRSESEALGEVLTWSSYATLELVETAEALSQVDSSSSSSSVDHGDSSGEGGRAGEGAAGEGERGDKDKSMGRSKPVDIRFVGDLEGDGEGG